MPRCRRLTPRTMFMIDVPSRTGHVCLQAEPRMVAAKSVPFVERRHFRQHHWSQSYFTRPRRTSSIAMTVGLLRRGGQQRASAALQLPRALGGHDDEPVGALIRIVRNGAVRVVAGWRFAIRLTSYACSKRLQDRPDLFFDPRICRTRSARTIDVERFGRLGQDRY